MSFGANVCGIPATFDLAEGRDSGRLGSEAPRDETVPANSFGLYGAGTVAWLGEEVIGWPSAQLPQSNVVVHLGNERTEASKAKKVKVQKPKASLTAKTPELQHNESR